jgi:hypothetical protein
MRTLRRQFDHPVHDHGKEGQGESAEREISVNYTNLGEFDSARHCRRETIVNNKSEKRGTIGLGCESSRRRRTSMEDEDENKSKVELEGDRVKWERRIQV